VSRRSLATLAAVAVAGTALVPLLAETASAALPAPTDFQVVVADTDGDGGTGVYRRDPGGSLVVDTGEDPDRYIQEVTASRDGSRYAFAREDSVGETTISQIVVKEADGSLVRVLDKRTLTATSPEYVTDAHPALSPDGSELVWTQFFANASAQGTRLFRANLTTGAVTMIAGSGNRAAWTYLTPTTLISYQYTAALDNCTGIQTLPITGGTATAVAGVDCHQDNEFTVSPSGTKIAWTYTASETSQTADIRVADLSVAGDGTATISNAVTRVTGLVNHGPAWSSDSSTLRFLKFDDSDSESPGPGDVWTVPADGSSAPVQQSTAADELSVANTVRDGVAPTTTVTPLPFLLAGDRARLNWSLTGSDADLAGIQITRTGGAGTVVTRVPGAATTTVDTGLTIGTTYTYSIRAVDHSGNLGTAATRQMQAIRPYATVADPTSSASTTETFTVALPPQGTYGVRVRINSAAPTTWIAPDGTANHGGGHTFAGHRGTSYAFLITSRDAFGNASPETSGSSTVVPLDQTSATYAGNTAPQALPGQYLGSARVLRAAGAYGQITVKGNRFQIVGDRCGSCGIFDVYVNGVRVVGIDTRNAAHQVRQVLYSRPLNPAISSTIVIKARGTAGRPNVVLDGFALRK
jgi:hypothetical protein